MKRYKHFTNTNLDSTFHFSFLSNGKTDRQQLRFYNIDKISIMKCLNGAVVTNYKHKSANFSDNLIEFLLLFPLIELILGVVLALRNTKLEYFILPVSRFLTIL